MKIKFFRYLDVFHLIQICLLSKSYDEIYYFNISPLSNILLISLGLRQFVKPFKFQLAEVKDKSGTAYFPKIYGKDLIYVCDSIEEELRKNAFILKFGEMFGVEKVILYFRKIANRETSDLVVYINVVAWHRLHLSEREPNAIEFAIEHTPFFETLRKFALKECGLSVTSYPSLRILFKHNYLFFGNLYLSAVVCIAPILMALRFIFRSTKQVAANRTSPVVASSYTLRGLTFDLTERCDFPWLLMSDIPYEQVLLYFERKDMPPTEDMMNLLKQRGINYMAMSSVPAASKELSVYRSTMRVTRMLLVYTARVVFLACKEILSLRFGSLAYLSWVLYFTREYSKASDFYHINGIKINIDITDHDPYRIPRQLALEANGGISISYQISNWPIPNVILGSGADIMFLFGPYYYQTLIKSGTRNKRVIFNGYLSDYSFVPVRGKSIKLRERLANKGANFIICYFDENSSDETMGVISNKNSALIYRTLLNWVLSDDSIGLICSPKRPKTLLMRMPEIADLIKKSTDTGRCIFLAGEYTAQNYPNEPAQASDIVISLLIGGTTSLENFLSGSRVAYLDLEGLYSYPEYRNGKNTLVFDNLDDLTSAIRRYRQNREAFGEFGNINLAPGIKDKDPFHDGRAAARMGQYINWLLDMFNQGKRREDAIEYADRIYAERWGEKNVVKWH